MEWRGEIMIANNKRLYLIFYILSNSSDYTRAEDISQRVGISVRTVKNDISVLKQMAETLGCEVISKKGSGYKIFMKNQEVFIEIKEQVDIYFGNLQFVRADQFSYTNDIVRLLLARGDYIKSEDIINLLMISKNAFNHDIREAKIFLSDYNLKLISKPHHGFKITGSEFNIRMCMVELYELHYHGASHDHLSKDFLSYFKIDSSRFSQLRQSLLFVLRKSSMSIPDTFVNRLTIYLILQFNRYPEFKMSKNNLLLIDMDSFEEHRVAKELWDILCKNYDYQYDLTEIKIFTSILLMWSDLYQYNECKQNYPHQLQEAKDMVVIGLRKLDSQLNYNLIDNSYALYKILPAMIPLMFQIKCGCSGFKIISSVTETSEIHQYPLCMFMANAFASGLEESENCKISDYNRKLLASCFFGIVESFQYSYKKRSIVICSRTGKSTSENIKLRILRTFNYNLFQEIHIKELYEIRAMNMNELDYVLLNFPSYSYKYPVPFMAISNNMDRQELRIFYEKVILGGYNLSVLLHNLVLDVQLHTVNFNVDNDNEFENILFLRLSKYFSDYDGFSKYLSNLQESIFFGNKAFIFFPITLVSNVMFEILEFQKITYYKKHLIKEIYLVSFNFHRNDERLKLINHISYLIMNSRISNKTLVSADFKKTLELQIRELIQN